MTLTGAVDQRWCILRMAGPRTLSVVDALQGAGMDAWTPTRMFCRRRPRSKATIDQRAPIAPTFAFVRASHIPAIRAAMLHPISPFPPFSIFQHAGRIPLIADSEIVGLRAEEAKSVMAWDEEMQRRAAKRARDERDAQRKRYPTGARVRATDGPAAGMSGVVLKADRKWAVVDFGGSFEVRIDSFLLAESELQPGLAA